MPGKGKHRRPKSRSISRGLAVAGTGGAALALPLMGAAGANAAPAASVPAQSAQAPEALRVAVPVAGSAAAASTAGAPTVYTVVPGDHLSKIAAERHIDGGWEQLYADNREAVGENPSLIHPGLELNLVGGRDAAPAPKAPAAPAEESSTGAPAGSEGVGGKAQAPKGSGKATAGKPSRTSGGAAAQGSGAAAKSEKAAAPAAPAAASGFTSPVAGGVSTHYRVSGAMWSSGYHTGVDFIASTGTTIRAVGAGTVVSAGWGGSYGNQVVIRHADGKYSQYGHLSSLSVSAGQSVTGGQTIGLSGATGNVTGPHLHFEIRTGPSYGSDIDPLGYLRSKGVSI